MSGNGNSDEVQFPARVRTAIEAALEAFRTHAMADAGLDVVRPLVAEYEACENDAAQRSLCKRANEYLNSSRALRVLEQGLAKRFDGDDAVVSIEPLPVPDGSPPVYYYVQWDGSLALPISALSDAGFTDESIMLYEHAKAEHIASGCDCGAGDTHPATPRIDIDMQGGVHMACIPLALLAVFLRETGQGDAAQVALAMVRAAAELFESGGLTGQGDAQGG